MTVWIIWLLAVGLIFGLGLASSNIARKDRMESVASNKRKVKVTSGGSSERDSKLAGFVIPDKSAFAAASFKEDGIGNLQNSSETKRVLLAELLESKR